MLLQILMSARRTDRFVSTATVLTPQVVTGVGVILDINSHQMALFVSVCHNKLVMSGILYSHSQLLFSDF